MSKYEDIINLPHHVSSTRVPMSMANRAAQFAPFAALSGHDDAITETARITAEKPELSVDELYKLSQRLLYAIERNIEITVTWFRPDPLKPGGSYQTICGKVKKIDDAEGLIIFTDRRSIPLDSVLRINCPLFPDNSSSAPIDSVS